jgi:hypothetical protein
MQCGFHTAAGQKLDTKISKERTKLAETAAGRAAMGSAAVVAWLVAGGIACLACLAGWIAIAYYGDVEIGWLAILVGVIIGASMSVTGTRRLNGLSGLIAAGYTFLVVAGWKIAILLWLGDKFPDAGGGQTAKMLAFSALFAVLGCGMAFKIGSYGIGAARD